MKKSVSILVAFLFLLSTSGFAINIHNCSLKEFSLFSSTHKCCCEQMEMASNCCKNEANFFKIADDFSGASTVVVPFAQTLTFITLANHVLKVALAPQQNINVLLTYRDDPPEKPVALSILYRSILI